MSLEAMKWAMNEAPLEANASQCRNRLVLMALAEHYDDDTIIAYSVAAIAEQLNLSKNTVHKALTALEETGLIQRAWTHAIDHTPPQYRPTAWTLNLNAKGEK